MQLRLRAAALALIASFACVHAVSVSLETNHGREQFKNKYVWDVANADNPNLRGFRLPEQAFVEFKSMMHNVLIGLSFETTGSNQSDFEFVIGGWENTVSLLRSAGTDLEYAPSKIDVINGTDEVSYRLLIDQVRHKLELSYKDAGGNWVILISHETPTMVGLRTVAFSNYIDALTVSDITVGDLSPIDLSPFVRSRMGWFAGVENGLSEDGKTYQMSQADFLATYSHAEGNTLRIIYLHQPGDVMGSVDVLLDNAEGSVISIPNAGPKTIVSNAFYIHPLDS